MKVTIKREDPNQYYIAICHDTLKIKTDGVFEMSKAASVKIKDASYVIETRETLLDGPKTTIYTLDDELTLDI